MLEEFNKISFYSSFLVGTVSFAAQSSKMLKSTCSLKLMFSRTVLLTRVLALTIFVSATFGNLYSSPAKAAPGQCSEILSGSTSVDRHSSVMPLTEALVEQVTDPDAKRWLNFWLRLNDGQTKAKSVDLPIDLIKPDIRYMLRNLSLALSKSPDKIPIMKAYWDSLESWPSRRVRGHYKPRGREADFINAVLERLNWFADQEFVNYAGYLNIVVRYHEALDTAYGVYNNKIPYYIDPELPMSDQISALDLDTNKAPRFLVVITRKKILSAKNFNAVSPAPIYLGQILDRPISFDGRKGPTREFTIHDLGDHSAENMISDFETLGKLDQDRFDQEIARRFEIYNRYVNEINNASNSNVRRMLVDLWFECTHERSRFMYRPSQLKRFYRNSVYDGRIYDGRGETISYGYSQKDVDETLRIFRKFVFPE